MFQICWPSEACFTLWGSWRCDTMWSCENANPSFQTQAITCVLTTVVQTNHCLWGTVCRYRCGVTSIGGTKYQYDNILLCGRLRYNYHIAVSRLSCQFDSAASLLRVSSWWRYAMSEGNVNINELSEEEADSRIMKWKEFKVQRCSSYFLVWSLDPLQLLQHQWDKLNVCSHVCNVCILYSAVRHISDVSSYDCLETYRLSQNRCIVILSLSWVMYHILYSELRCDSHL